MEEEDKETGSSGDHEGGAEAGPVAAPGAHRGRDPGTRQGRLGLVPHVQSKIAKIVHASNGKLLRHELREREGRVAKRAYVRFTGVREKGAMAFVECQGRSPFDTMEPSLWRETLGRCLGSHDQCDPIGGTCHGAGCSQPTTRLHTLSCPKTGWGTRTHSQVLHQAVARSLRECSLDICLEDTTPFQASAQARHGSHPLRMDVTVGPSALFRGHRQREERHLLLDLTVVNPCAPSNLDKEVTRPGTALAEAAKRKQNKYRGTFRA